jgi:2-succinyl-5-enolpyruvyl-6-hydroxy-3-cyclohexene-1-carboxylate synthase
MSATDSYLLLRAFCDELARSGMEHACTSPGSRCAPIVLSLTRERRIRSWSHLDERCAGFFAVGAAKGSGRPVAVACTSGTAAANLAPAVIEARWARVPLIVLTADRPPELRDVGAGQTIDQLKLYGDAVKWFFEVGLDGGTAQRLRWIRTLACRAYATAVAHPAGPVHLNFPLREPLVIDVPLPDDRSGRRDGQPYVIVEPPHIGAAAAGGPAAGSGAAATAAGPAAADPATHPSGRIVIVAGTGTPDPAGVASFAERAGIPLFADPLSGARRGAAAIAHYDLLLRAREFAASARPQFVFRLGDLPTSKPLRAWLAGSTDAAQIAFDPDNTWQDPDNVVGMRLQSALPQPDGLSVEEGWLDGWRDADRKAADAINETLGDELSEPLVARKVGEWLGPDATLFVASSMPIRDAETFLPAGAEPPRVIANRGANGIDGTVSSAFGVAATGALTVLLIGDVALAHDIGGLLAARRVGLPLTIVVLNNDGGGIFHFLPIATQRDAFEEHVATPHGLDFERVAELYGCGYERPRDVTDLQAAAERSLGSRGTAIIEVRTDREENLALHKRVAAAVSARLERGL